LTFVLVASPGIRSARANEGKSVAPGPPPDQLLCLVDAYPDHLAGARWEEPGGWALVWKDGTLMDWDDGRRDKDFETLLNEADLQDMMSIPYPRGTEYDPPGKNDDPGRIRYDPFFRKMYGDSARAVEKRLVRIRWLPRTGGKKLRVMSVNGLDQALARVSDDIEKLPRKIRSLAKETSGPFNWRVIKGTKRLSSHSFAIALDVAVKHAHYWRWTRPDKDGNRPYRNKIPLEIVEAFERHGFIWGGKWYHYDTMHFEYRPELLDPRCTRKRDRLHGHLPPQGGPGHRQGADPDPTPADGLASSSSSCTKGSTACFELTIFPNPPQCVVLSPGLAAGRPSMRTFGSPSAITNVFGPQQAAAMPRSPLRAMGHPPTMTFGLAVMIGPITE